MLPNTEVSVTKEFGLDYKINLLHQLHCSATGSTVLVPLHSLAAFLPPVPNTPRTLCSYLIHFIPASSPLLTSKRPSSTAMTDVPLAIYKNNLVNKSVTAQL